MPIVVNGVLPLYLPLLLLIVIPGCYCWVLFKYGGYGTGEVLLRWFCCCSTLPMPVLMMLLWSVVVTVPMWPTTFNLLPTWRSVFVQLFYTTPHRNVPRHYCSVLFYDILIYLLFHCRWYLRYSTIDDDLLLRHMLRRACCTARTAAAVLTATVRMTVVVITFVCRYTFYHHCRYATYLPPAPLLLYSQLLPTHHRRAYSTTVTRAITHLPPATRNGIVPARPLSMMVKTVLFVRCIADSAVHRITGFHWFLT